MFAYLRAVVEFYLNDILFYHIEQSELLVHIEHVFVS